MKLTTKRLSSLVSDDGNKKTLRSVFTFGKYYTVYRDTTYCEDYKFATWNIQANESFNPYLPDVYSEFGSGFTVVGFSMQTTSYGSLLGAELEKYMEAQKIGFQLVKALNAFLENTEC